MIYMGVRLILFFILFGAIIWIILNFLIPSFLNILEKKKKKKEQENNDSIGFRIIK